MRAVIRGAAMLSAKLFENVSMAEMNILFTSPTFRPFKGGAETCIEELARTFAQQGHAVAVVTARLSPSLPSHERLSGVDVHRLDYPPQRWGLKTSLPIVIRGVGLVRVLWRLIRSRRVDVVCIGLVGIEVFPVRLLKRVAPFRLVVYLHGAELRSYVRVSWFMRRALRACLRACDAVIAVSEGLRDEAVAFEPRVRRKVQVISNGIDVSVFAHASPYRHPSPYVLYVGRLHPVKGLDTLIRAFRRIATRLPHLDLVIAGNGPEEGRLRALTEESGLASRIVFLGAQERPQIAALLQGCEFVVLPSRSEGCPVVVVEAMAAGRMTVGSRVNGIAEILGPNGAGVLFEAGDDRQLAELICTYHEDTPARDVLAANARRAGPAHDIRDLAARHLAAYEGAGRPLAVGLISLFYYRDPSCAGLSTYYFNLARSLSDLGHDVYTITTPDSGDAPPAGRLVTVPVARERLLERAQHPSLAGGLRRIVGRCEFAWKAYRAARRLDRAEGLDAVIAPELFGQGLFASLGMGKKLITRVHTPTWIGDRYNERRWPLVTKVVTMLERSQVRRSRAVCVASAQLGAIVQHTWRIPPGRLHVIPNTVQIDWIRSLAGTPPAIPSRDYLLYFGRLEKRKGVQVLSDALHEVFASHLDVAMVFIGRDEGLKQTITEAHRHHERRIHFCEAMDKAPLFGAIREARLVVLPSLFENMSNAGLEAMALARPVVGTYGTAFEEIIEDGVNGFLTPPGDAAALAAKILSCLQRPDLEEVGRRGFETVRRFDSRAIGPRYAELCRQIASRP